MKYPVKNYIYEKVKQVGNILDTDLMSDFAKNGYEVSVSDLNKALLHLEIFGLITVRWVGKDKRRIELVQAPQASA